MKRLLGLLLLVPLMALPAYGGDVGFAEQFALAKDRSAALKQLIPGTEDYYYYHCLNYLLTEQFDKAVELTKPWIERYGQTQRLTEIQTRHALLNYEKDPAKTLAYLRDRLGLHFDHQREILGVPPDLPSSLDQKLIARAALRARSISGWQNLDNFEDSALDWLAGTEMNWERQRNLLQRVQRPDVPGIVKIIVDDMKQPHPQEFGAYPVHFILTLAQLEELLKLRPDLLNHGNFIRAYITKLQPGADDDWKRDRKLTAAYLDRLQAFADRLAPVHNAFKAHVQYHRLAFDRAEGKYDRAKFMAYLQLPRMQPYMSKDMLEREEFRRHPADLNADYTPMTLLPRIGHDEDLVRSYLQQYFIEATDIKAFEPYINDTYLTHLFAETKVEHGLGDPESWAAKLPPELFRAIKDRIDIDFAYTNKSDFAANEPVALDLFIKNVPTLLVKVFEVNTGNVYRTTLKEVDTDLNLDGLVANVEKAHKYDDSPLRRLPRRFEFPELAKPGVYVIDFIGAGKSSRALVRKGKLRPIVVNGSVGQVISVVDEMNQPVKDATLWLSGTEYKADKDGTIAIPYSTSPGNRPVVLTRGDFSSLDSIPHRAESYSLVAGIHVDREALLTQKVAAILIRPGVFLNGGPASVKLLEDVRLRIIATDHNGIATSTEVPNFVLFEDRESIHEVRVPPRLASLSVTLTGKIKNLSTGKPIDLSASQSFTLNGIDRSDKIEDLHFARFGTDYVIELLGRTGEAKPDRAVGFAIKHRDFKEPVHVTLKTDGRGRVNLGPLVEIASVTATGPEGTSHNWALPTDRFTYRQVMHAVAGDVVSVPYLGTAAAPSREEFALFEVRGTDIRSDKFDQLSIKDGLLQLRGLAAGDYDLWLKRSGDRIRIRIVDGNVFAQHVVGKTRYMELPGLKPVQIAAIAADAEFVTIKLTDASKYARVHLFATRYLPEYSAFADLGRVRDDELQGGYPAQADSTFLTGRNIGDEYRYVLDRKGQRKYAGNMLERPMLLLNPWAVRTTETGEQLAAGGEAFGARGMNAPGMAAAPPAPKSEAPGERGAALSGNFADLDFLADASAVVVNLIPDKDGFVRVPRAQVGPHTSLHVIAVDPLHTVARSTSLPEVQTDFVDLRLKNGLDPTKHFTQQKQVSQLVAGRPFTLTDVAASRFEAYDSLPKVYALYATLSRDPKLAEFSFLLTWPKQKLEEKRALYSKFACHELNYFLFKKDPEFFATVVKPFIANKKDKTFLDRWLLDEDVSSFLAPWEYGRLNAVERVLLARKVVDEGAKTARHLGDMLRLLPPNQAREVMLFDSAVANDSLGLDDSLGYKQQNRQLDQREKFKALGDAERQSDKPGVAGEPQGGAMGGLGGGGPGGGGFGGGGGRPGMAAAPGGPPAGRPEAAKKAAARDGKSDAAKDAKESESLDESRKRRGAEMFFEADRASGRAVRQLYRKLDPTQEWAENNYYHLRVHQQIADLVPVGAFWLDYAKHDGKDPFLSRYLAEASRNFTEMAFALSVLDLPFEAGKHETKFDGGKMTLTPAGPVIAFHEEVRPTEGKGGQVPILISQNFYKHGDRYRDENGERLDKFVTDEFVIQTVYGCQVVVTNPTSSRQKLSVLVQLPVGSIAVNNGQFTRTVPLDLEPYRTQTIDYLFYFPLPGKFAQFPVHVAKNEQFVIATAPATFNVVAKPSKLDTTSWDYVSQNGAMKDVLDFLERENVNALNLEKLAFRMKDRAAYEPIVKLLRQRHVYQPTLWSYAILHADVPVARQFLQHTDQIVNECAGPIDSALLTVDPVVRHQYEHLEYKPLVNARAHALGQTRQIVNDAFHAQYHAFLKTLTYHRTLDDTDLLATTYYLLLQDRIDEALETFARINPDKVATKIQYDYCSAYLDMFTDAPIKARSIAAKYINHPVDRWRNTFAAITAQLDEIEGKGTKVVDPMNQGQQQGALAATEPGFEFNLDNKAINLTWQNLSDVRVNYYLMDVELLFSRNPFVQQSGNQFASIRPNKTAVVKLPAGQSKFAVPLPDDLASRNVLVEIVAAGKTRSAPYYANAMDVKFTETYGQLKAADAAGKPLSKVYVKVYARLADGSVKFHKDGYTDLRGRFDYASVNTPERQAIDRFSVLVLSDTQGATIREAAPPQP